MTLTVGLRGDRYDYLLFQALWEQSLHMQICHNLSFAKIRKQTSGRDHLRVPDTLYTGLNYKNSTYT